jgi:hypothetical protein
LWYAKQDHRVDSLTHKLAGNVSKESAPQPKTLVLNPTEKVNASTKRLTPGTFTRILLI